MITSFGGLRLNHHEALQEFQYLVEESRSEPGCPNYVVSADLVDPVTLYVFEQWDDDEALEAHQRSEQFVAHGSRSGGHVVAAGINHYECGSAERRTVGLDEGRHDS